MRFALALALPLALAGGCRRGPGYARPALDLPAQHRGVSGAELASLPDGGTSAPGASAASGASMASLADLPWWEVFRDPALQALLGDAVSRNHDLGLAAARVAETRAIIGAVHSERLPQVEGTRRVSRDQSSQSSTFTGDRVSTNYSAAIGASWELDLWGRVRRGEQAALADYLASEHGRRAVVVALVADVAEAYVRLRTADLLLEITERTIGTRRSTSDLFQKRLDGGLGSRLEVSRASGDLAASRADAPRIAQLVATHEHRLSLLAGRNPGPIARGAGIGADLLPPEVPAGLPSTLIERRPDVLAAEQRLRAATARVGVARAEWMPRLSLTGLLGLESRDLNDLLTGDSVRWSLGSEVLAPLFTGGRLCANERIAWAQLEQARQSYLQSVRSALRDVADALVAIRRSREVRQELEGLVGARSEALKMALTRFEGGLASYIEVLDSQRELFPAELQLAEARRDELLAVIQLYRALGGGWQGGLEPSSRCGAPLVAPPLPAGVGGPTPFPPPATMPAPTAPLTAPASPPVGAPTPSTDPVEARPPAPPPEPPAGTAYALPPAGPLPAAGR